MQAELSKINYPINSELKELQKSFMDSFVIRQLGQKGKRLNVLVSQYGVP